MQFVALSSDKLNVLSKLSLVFACCVVSMLHSLVVLFQEFLFWFTASFHLASVKHAIFADRIREAIGYALGDSVNDEDAEHAAEAEGPLLASKVDDLENKACERDDEELEADDDAPDEQEDKVVKEAGEDVPFIVDLSGADHVSDLHHDEQVEEEGEVSAVATWVNNFGGIMCRIAV